MSAEPTSLRIAMVVASPFPANHGTPGSIREMAEAVAAQGHQVHVVTYHSGTGLLPPGVQVHRIRDLGFGRDVVVGPTWYKPLLDLALVGTLCRVICQERIDLMHAHNYEGALVGAMARLVTRRPLVYNAINTMGDELASYNFLRPQRLAVWLARALDYWVPRLADQIVAISDELAGFLATQKISPERFQMIPLGIDLTPFQGHGGAAIRAQYHLGQHPVVMYTGILDRLQRIDYLLRAMRLVIEHVADARLVLVVNLVKAEDLQACQAMIRALDLEGHVTIVTERTFAEIPAFLAAADVTVVSRPHCPGFPVKLLNYMAAGKPIVLFAGSAKGLGHMQQAFVAPDHDWQGLGHGIMTLLRDPELAARLGRNAQQWVSDQFAWPRLVARLEQVYAKVL